MKGEEDHDHNDAGDDVVTLSKQKSTQEISSYLCQTYIPVRKEARQQRPHKFNVHDLCSFKKMYVIIKFVVPFGETKTVFSRNTVKLSCQLVSSSRSFSQALQMHHN